MLRKLLGTRELGVVAMLIAMIVATQIRFSIEPGGWYFTSKTINDITLDFSFVAIAAIGATIVVLTGGIDLSSGSMMALGACAMACFTTRFGLPPAVAIPAAVLCGVMLGSANGLLITKLGHPPFIATLGMLWIARGIAFVFVPIHTDVAYLTDRSRQPLVFAAVGDGSFWVLVALTVLATLFLTFTKWGRYVYAIGGNEEASRFSGVPVQWTKIGVYAAAGLFSALAGAGHAVKYGGADSGTALGYELDIIAAVVVGGVSLNGGQGSVIGAVLGALAMKLLKDMLLTFAVPAEYIQITYGCAILLAVSVDQLARRGWSGRFEKGIGRRNV